MKKIDLPRISWLFFSVLSVVFYFTARSFPLFPSSFRFPLLIIETVLIAVLGFLSFKKIKVSSVLNIALSLCLAVGCAVLPKWNKQLTGVFAEPEENETVGYGLFALSSEYKKGHEMHNTILSDDISDYSSARFLKQKAVDTKNQEAAVKLLSKQMNNDLDIVECEDIPDMIDHLYERKGDAVFLNISYLDTLAETKDYSEFEKDTVELARFEVKVTKETDEKPKDSDEKGAEEKSQTGLTFLIAGSDTRSERLSTHGRTDVDILLSFNIDTKQALIVSIPRDYFIENPALGNGLDKLTHLGNNGIENTMAGLEQKFAIDIDHYTIVNFASFKNIIDALEGIVVDNPYTFSTVGSNGDGKYGGEYEFPKGSVKMDGQMALAYVRERYRLPEGDFGRNEHQMLVLEAVIKKLASQYSITHLESILMSLQGQFLTDMPAADIYKLAADNMTELRNWNIVSYHLGGYGSYAATASMGRARSYVTVPIETQVPFVCELIHAVVRGDTITQDILPK